MKKKIIMAFLAGMLVILAGCSSNQPDETGVYVDSKGVMEVSMGIEMDDTQRSGCTVKIPKNYFIYGDGVNEDGLKRYSVLRWDRLEKYTDEKKLDGYTFCYLLFGPKGGKILNGEFRSERQRKKHHRFYFEMFSNERGNFQSLESYAPSNGFWISSDTMRGYAYEEPAEGPHRGLRLTMHVPINHEMILRMGYEGPLLEELGVKELGERMLSLVTPIK